MAILDFSHTAWIEHINLGEFLLRSKKKNPQKIFSSSTEKDPSLHDWLFSEPLRLNVMLQDILSITHDIASVPKRDCHHTEQY